MVFEPGLGLPAGVLGVIVLLEHHITWGFAIIIEGSLEIILHNLAVEVSIHPPINLACISWPFPGHTAHIISEPPPNFWVPSTRQSERASPALFHTHFHTSEPSWLILVSSDHTTLFQSSIVQCLWLRAKSIHSHL